MKLTVDHVLPRTLGGTNEAGNLVTACHDCNSGKSSIAPDSPIVDNVADDALRWANAMDLAAKLAANQRAQRRHDIENFDTVWGSWFTEEQEAEYDCFRDPNWRHSIERFIDAGLTIYDLTDMAEDILSRGRVKNGGIWRYFCGACWRTLETRQETARSLIDSGEADACG